MTSDPVHALAAEIEDALRRRDFASLRTSLTGWDPKELADLIEELGVEDQAIIFRILPREPAAGTFEYLSPELQEGLIKGLAREDVAAILNEMAPDERTRLLEEMPASATKQLLALLTPEERAVAVRLLGYPEDTIGRLMTPDYLAVRSDWTVQQVLDHIRAHGRDSETLNVIYVVDEKGRLVDDLRIRQLLVAPTGARVADISDGKFASLRGSDDQESAIAVFQAYDRVALPVTDSQGVLLGIVTVDDVLDVAAEEATEDIHKIGGTEALDEPYMATSILSLARKRGKWLVVLFFGEMLTTSAMGWFEEEIARAVVLALFVPLIISSGGNSGSQASTLVIRAMALGEVAIGDWWKVVRRELQCGLLLGTVLGLIGLLRVAVWQGFFDSYGAAWPLVGLTVAAALLGVVVWGTLVGSMLPFVLRSLGLDPAVSSAPFVATLVDVTGLVLYFSVALLLLRGTLL